MWVEKGMGGGGQRARVQRERGHQKEGRGERGQREMKLRGIGRTSSRGREGENEEWIGEQI